MMAHSNRVIPGNCVDNVWGILRKYACMCVMENKEQ